MSTPATNPSGSMATATHNTNFDESRIDKYILGCKLIAHKKTTRYKNKHEFLSESEFCDIYNYECSRCLEKYYTYCLKDVKEHAEITGGRKNLAVCDKIIDVYFQNFILKKPKC